MEKVLEKEADPQALIFDIQGHAVHDGPGGRTLVFLSGCPLECGWCANPEGMLTHRRLMYSAGKCPPHCDRCVEVCPNGAIHPNGRATPRMRFDRDLCDACESFDCVEVCYPQALRVCGRRLTLSDLMGTLERDRDFWGSEGGVTFSGGEPLAQLDFLRAALGCCRDSWIHTAVETSAHVPADDLLSILPLTDLLMVDVKHMDPEIHREWTGHDNETILHSLRTAARHRGETRILARVPLIPGFNDTVENLRATGKYLREIGLSEMQLLPFHRLGNSKYTQLGIEDPCAGIRPPGSETLEASRGILVENGIRCYVGNDAPF
jgi:pyruvate formate lyase activating enzyme